MQKKVQQRNRVFVGDKFVPLQHRPARVALQLTTQVDVIEGLVPSLRGTHGEQSLNVL